MSLIEDTTTSKKKIEEGIAIYIAVRDKIKEIEERHKEELAPLVEKQNSLTGWLQEFLDTAGAQSIKTKHGTVISSTRYTTSLADPQAFMNYVIKNSAFDLMDRKANSTAVRDFVEEHKALPPGVNLNAIRTVGVRRASGK